eukprot:4439662-Pyramimonas_sp.AAC.1
MNPRWFREYALRECSYRADGLADRWGRVHVHGWARTSFVGQYLEGRMRLTAKRSASVRALACEGVRRGVQTQITRT